MNAHHFIWSKNLSNPDWDYHVTACWPRERVDDFNACGTWLASMISALGETSFSQARGLLRHEKLGWMWVRWMEHRYIGGRPLIPYQVILLSMPEAHLKVYDLVQLEKTLPHKVVMSDADRSWMPADFISRPLGPLFLHNGKQVADFPLFLPNADTPISAVTLEEAGLPNFNVDALQLSAEKPDQRNRIDSALATLTGEHPAWGWLSHISRTVSSKEESTIKFLTARGVHYITYIPSADQPSKADYETVWLPRAALQPSSQDILAPQPHLASVTQAAAGPDQPPLKDVGVSTNSSKSPTRSTSLEESKHIVESSIGQATRSSGRQRRSLMHLAYAAAILMLITCLSYIDTWHRGRFESLNAKFAAKDNEVSSLKAQKAEFARQIQTLEDDKQLLKKEGNNLTGLKSTNSELTKKNNELTNSHKELLDKYNTVREELFQMTDKDIENRALRQNGTTWLGLRGPDTIPPDKRPKAPFHQDIWKDYVDWGKQKDNRENRPLP